MLVQAETPASLQVSQAQHWYLRRNKSPTLDAGIHESVSLPSPLDCVGGRLLNGSYLMQRVYSEGGSGAVGVSCSHSRRLLRIELEDDECVCFNAKFLVGFSSGVRLRSYLNLSLAAFGCDQNFVCTARRRERTLASLLFEANGEPECPSSRGGTFDPSRLIAWDSRVGFKFSKLQTLFDAYLTRPRVDGEWYGFRYGIVLDADHGQSGTSMGSLWRMIRSVYLPGQW